MKKRIICSILAVSMMAAGTLEARAGVQYTVQRGDSLWKISKLYDTTVDAIVAANDISNPDLIHVNQVLEIPVDGQETAAQNEVAEPAISETVPLPVAEELPVEPVMPTEAAEPVETGQETGDMRAAIDAEYTKNVMFTIGDFGDDPATGNRSAGSEAEYQVSQYIYGLMNEIGLENVTIDKTTVDTWQYNGASVTYTDEEAFEHTIHLGGYATNLVLESDEMALVYAGKGTAKDYEGLDVKGKLVLIDIDQYNEWWINWPAYQAYVKGAKAVIAVNVAGYAQLTEDTMGSQDICGPAFAPAFAISKNGANALKTAIENSGEDHISVKFKADSVVEKNGNSQNVWGEIKGKSEEVLYFMAHYDGYYHSVYDDAAGVATILTIAKAMMESGYQPEKTIRFVTHGAEEWGKIDSAYDWSIGAYQQIMKNHPEWAENAFALINVDGCYPLDMETVLSVYATYEMADFTENFANDMRGREGRKFAVYTYAPTSTGTEDFIYQRAGVPAVVAVSSKDSTTPYREGAYHSNSDAKDLGFNSDYSEYVTYFFMSMAVTLDGLAVKPLDFANHFGYIQSSFEEGFLSAELSDAFEGAVTEAVALKEKIDAVNEAYHKAVASGDTAASEAIKDAVGIINKELYALYKEMQGKFIRLGWEENMIAPHENHQENVLLLQAAIEALENGDIEEVLDEYLWDVDYNWYAYYFDKETFSYFAKQYIGNAGGTFGEGLLVKPNEDLFDVIAALNEKLPLGEEADLSEEVAALRAALENQQGYLAEILQQEYTDLIAFTVKLEGLNNRFHRLAEGL